MEKKTKIKPILKWAGGKSQMIEILEKTIPTNYGKYIEPFIGGGALYFHLQPKNAIIADTNEELINMYKTVVNDVEGLIYLLNQMINDKEFFLLVRAEKVENLTEVERAARMIYLNRTCFNGLYRVNKKGQFNVPFGNYSNPKICDQDNLRSASKLLKTATIICADYKQVLDKYCKAGDFIFLDPPYLPISKYSDFKRYTKEQFYIEDHKELADIAHNMRNRACTVVITNSNHEMVYDLFSHERTTITVYSTSRRINSDASKRTGEDVVIELDPKKDIVLSNDVDVPLNIRNYPTTRYMGSKSKLIDIIYDVSSHFEFDTVLDLFSGSGIVSYLFKTMGKKVYSNDYMHFSYLFSKALIENNKVRLDSDDINYLLENKNDEDRFVSNTFQHLYFSDVDNSFIDRTKNNIQNLDNEYKRALAMSALVRACMKKRPRGIFTYIGLDKYDDGRKDVKLSLKKQFENAVTEFNDAVFDNKQRNKSFNVDAMDLKKKVDLVYLDPPYYSPLSDNEYVRRYHFVEGLSKNWVGVDIQQNTKTKKIKNYPTPFSNRANAYEAFEKLFKKYKESIIMVSYSSNSFPTKEEMIGLLSKFKRVVEVLPVEYTYSFANKGEGNPNNKVKEYIFIAY
ncbi:Dam family site-specific DNA-(adenine-N6)-methyltransferase [Enterococcus sp. CWB-B31]|uniref:Dam family site-specific DNA-(adenine-N6)-methyltransferase n=1 Tax=Enterococcus sp. CWB-B31 TaxID=2885159 RepID=UPI001E42A6DD|nr:Dam family site-specific DNA-(adenine-N6)-methyltransferase [Enterococcus sp. CWB-B31]MCB5953954.1 Dam family site-specific DNA-(adenine-N6)-methyltransferase [Enterococcus sp. CWB-B31]